MPKTGEILIYESIGGNWYGEGLTAKRFTQMLADLGQVDEVTVRINSPGGLVFDALAMHTSLQKHPAQVHVEIDGIAASAASFLAMAGDTVKIAANGFVMIHRALGLTIGNLNEHRKQADILEKIDSQIAGMYAARSKRDAAEHLTEMDAETWFTAEEAIAAGLVDAVLPAKEVSARFDPKILDNFSKTPAGLRERLATANNVVTAKAKSMAMIAEARSRLTL